MSDYTVSEARFVPSPVNVLWTRERILAGISGVLSVGVSVGVWQALRGQDPKWPLPGLYVIEVLVIGVVGALGVACDSRHPRPSTTLTWAAIGVQAAFVLLGAASIGLFYLPVAVLLLLAALGHDRRRRWNIAPRVAIAAAAALAQGALMAVVPLFW